MAARRPAGPATVKLTANFEANLGAIEAFLAERDAASAFGGLLGDLEDVVVPNLERFPKMGRRFPSCPPQSVEARERWAVLERRIDADSLREYLFGDYLILYAVLERNVYLLSITHHAQLSFDFARLWRG